MKVRGQTAKNVTLDLLEGAITWNLGKCIVVENLGVHLLVGEPGKIDNKINTKPETRTLETLNLMGQMISIPYLENRPIPSLPSSPTFTVHNQSNEQAASIQQAQLLTKSGVLGKDNNNQLCKSYRFLRPHASTKSKSERKPYSRHCS